MGTATSSVSGLITNVFIGFSLGASVAVSRAFGAKDVKEMHKAVHTSMLLSLCFGIFSCVVGFLFAKDIGCKQAV